jgi:hypothetical protein
MNLDIKKSLRKFYVSKFPSDELGVEIDPKATFIGLFDTLDNYEDVYEYIGVHDSIVRERCFEELALIMDVSYDEVYSQWMLEA